MRSVALLLVMVVGAMFAGRWLGREWSQPWNGLVASPTYAFIDGSKPGETGHVTFSLANQGRREVTIERVEFGCSCMDVSDLRGLILQPGQSSQLAVRIAIPDSGLEMQQLHIRHDAAPSPLTLTLEVLGRRHPPHLVGNAFKQAAFFELGSPATVETVRLTTCEPANAEPWLGAMTCELPEVTIDRRVIQEQRAGTALLRVYEYRVGWHQLPRSSEFYGKLWVQTTYGTPSTIEVGCVTGTRPAKH